MTAKYRVKRVLGYRSFTHTLAVRRYVFGLFPYWERVAADLEKPIVQLLDAMVMGDYDDKYYDAEGITL